MTNLEKSLHPPEFEIRADIFISRVRGVGMKIKKKFAYTDIFDLIVEKALETWMDRYDRLRSVSGDIDVTGLEELYLTADADVFDQQSANLCIVGLYGSCTSRQPLGELTDQTLFLADRMGGNINTDFMRGLSSVTQPDFIKQLHPDEPDITRYICRLFFTFE